MVIVVYVLKSQNVFQTCFCKAVKKHKPGEVFKQVFGSVSVIYEL